MLTDVMRSQVFFYGSRLVADQEYTTFEFFVCLMVSFSSRPTFWLTTYPLTH